MRPIFLSLLATAACSSASGAPPSATFPISTTSASGALRVTVDASPDPPAVGTEAFVYTVTDTSDGSPRDDMTLAVVPWMPSMQHGTATPTVTPLGGGKYRVSDVYLFMPGTWELETSFSGPVSDHADPSFELR